MSKINVSKRRVKRISQGDVFQEIECIESVIEKRGIIEVRKIVFPLVVVLTQDCDLEQDNKNKRDNRSSNNDKNLFSVLVAPIYNSEHVFQGNHLSDIGLKMAEINYKRTPGTMLMQNERPRYHYLDFPEDVPIVSSIIDFKHYFSVSIKYLEAHRSKHFVCRLAELYREDLSQRFAAYLARIGLPS